MKKLKSSQGHQGFMRNHISGQIKLGQNQSRVFSSVLLMSGIITKQTFYICENKDADQLCSNCTADQRLCFHYQDSTIILLVKYGISSH